MHTRWNAIVPGRSAVLWLMLLFFSPAATAQTTNADPLIVESTAGAVRIRLADAWQPPHVGMAVALPAVVSTGADGSIRLGQGATVITVAADTAVELYQGETGQTLQRVVQNRGSAFYDIAPRGNNRLRVETPYLVAVIKGTEFDVTVTADSSTVALFEGRLQVEAPDLGDVVDLHEGHIARRHRDDGRITVIRMDDGEPVARNETANGSRGSSGDGADGASGDAAIRSPDDMDGEGPLDSGSGIVIVDTAGGAGIDGGRIDTSVAGDLAVGESGLDTGLAGEIDPGHAGIGVALGAEADLGSADLDLAADVSADLGAGALDLGADLGADVGEVSLDAGLDLGADLGAGELDLGADLGADLGGASLDAGLDAGGDLDLGADLGADLGDTGVDVGLDTGVDLGSGDLGANLDADVDLGGDIIDVGAGADLGGGDVDVGVDVSVGDVDLGLDIDTGGGLDDLLDLDLGGSDAVESGDNSDDSPTLDLRGLLGL